LSAEAQAEQPVDLPPGPGEGESSASQVEAPASAGQEADQPPGPGEGDSAAAPPPSQKPATRSRAAKVKPVEEVAEPEGDELPKDWYILKVQSNRENSICDGLRRRVKIAGLEEYFDEIIVPTEEVREFKDGKARIVKRKLYPGYIVVRMAINDDTWFLVRETPGIGDFTGSGGKPTPMLPHEVERILRLAGKLERPDAKTGPRPLIPYRVGDKVRIEEGNFQNFEGEVSAIDETNGRVTIMIQIFNRTTPVELEHWQVKPL
jgi:transcriptional antiterminator NusG